MKTLKIQFNLANEKTTTLSLAEPKTGLTLASVTAAATAFINKQAIVVGGSPISSLKDCYIQEVNRIELS